MYQFTGKLKMLAIALMILGAVGTVISFMSAPKTLEDAKEILAKQHDAHHGDHAAVDSHKVDAKHVEEAHIEVKKHVGEVAEEHATDSTTAHVEEVKGEHAVTPPVDTVHTGKTKENHTEDAIIAHTDAKAHGENHEDAHAEHAFHQMQNRPWAAFFVALMFFLGVTLLVLAFYAIQRVAQAGWSVVLFRVMEAITANLHYVSIIMLVF